MMILRTLACLFFACSLHAVLTPLREDAFDVQLYKEAIPVPTERDLEVPESRRSNVIVDPKEWNGITQSLVSLTLSPAKEQEFYEQLRRRGSVFNPLLVFEEDGIRRALISYEWVVLESIEEGVKNFLEKLKLPSPRYQVSEHREEWHLLEIGLTQDWIVRETIECARKMMAHSRSGDALIILGNTPTFLARVLEHRLISQDPAHADYRRLVRLPASGKPASSFVSYRTAVTTERWHCFREYTRELWEDLGGKALQPHQIFVIDYIGQGDYIDHLIRSMVQTCPFVREEGRGLQSEELPHITLMSLNSWQKIQPHRRSGDFPLEETGEISERPLDFGTYEVSALGPFMSRKLVGIFDALHPSYRLAPTYYPCHWELRSPKEMQRMFDETRPPILDRVLEVWDHLTDRVLSEPQPN